jgi:hypothetical protein
MINAYKAVMEENEKSRICLGCGQSLFTKFRPQGGGTRRKWCSHRCASRLWHRNNKQRSNAIKRKSAAKDECKNRKSAYEKLHPSWARLTPEHKLWTGANIRAKERQIEFTIRPEHIQIPDICPLLAIPIYAGQKVCSANSASLDRIDSSKGYTPDNVWVISHRANTAKSDLTLEQLKQLVENFEKAMVQKAINENR